MTNEYLTTDELAALMRTSPATVRYWHHTGKAPRSIKVGRRRLYPSADVDTWREQLRTGGAGQARPA